MFEPLRSVALWLLFRLWSQKKAAEYGYQLRMCARDATPPSHSQLPATLFCLATFLSTNWDVLLQRRGGGGTRWLCNTEHIYKHNGKTQRTQTHRETVETLLMTHSLTLSESSDNFTIMPELSKIHSRNTNVQQFPGAYPTTLSPIATKVWCFGYKHSQRAASVGVFRTTETSYPTVLRKLLLTEEFMNI